MGERPADQAVTGTDVPSWRDDPGLTPQSVIDRNRRRAERRCGFAWRLRTDAQGELQFLGRRWRAPRASLRPMRPAHAAGRIRVRSRERHSSPARRTSSSTGESSGEPGPGEPPGADGAARPIGGAA